MPTEDGFGLNLGLNPRIQTWNSLKSEEGVRQRNLHGAERLEPNPRKQPRRACAYLRLSSSSQAPPSAAARCSRLCRRTCCNAARLSWEDERPRSTAAMESWAAYCRGLQQREEKLDGPGSMRPFRPKLAPLVSNAKSWTLTVFAFWLINGRQPKFKI